MNGTESETNNDAKAVQTFREAFRLIDHDNDSKLSYTDIENTLSSVGIGLDEGFTTELLNSRPDKSNSQELTFPVFLTMFKEKLDKMDNSGVLAESFESFDGDFKGYLNANELLRAVEEFGDVGELSKLIESGTFTDRMGNFHYSKWIESMSVNQSTQ
ncbi:hypothetical protein E3P77_02665 [Wallemia ichthyophaga]|nr:hypothetical protein E3P77_02665 [Wallemia ichthyophaga]